MFKYQWQCGPCNGGYESENEVDRNKVDAALKKLLTSATKGDGWKDPQRTKHIPVLVDGDVVGNLWDDVKFSDLIPPSHWAPDCDRRAVRTAAFRHRVAASGRPRRAQMNVPARVPGAPGGRGGTRGIAGGL